MNMNNPFLKFIKYLGHSNTFAFKAVAQRIGINRPRNVLFETHFDGMRYVGSLNQIIDRYIYFSGAYAKNELALLESFASSLRPIRENLCFVDIGANVGQHSLFMSRRVDVVYSFEPQDEALSQFRQNINLNKITNINIFPCALGDREHEVELGSGFQGNNGSRSILWTLEESKNTVIKVCKASKKFDDIGIGKIDILKMDVEGYEKTVFRGMRDRICADRPIIMFEMVGEGTKGGFGCLEEVQEHLYPNHTLFGVPSGAVGRLVDFDWGTHEEAVCLPLELVDRFKSANVF